MADGKFTLYIRKASVNPLLARRQMVRPRSSFSRSLFFLPLGPGGHPP